MTINAISGRPRMNKMSLITNEHKVYCFYPYTDYVAFTEITEICGDINNILNSEINNIKKNKIIIKKPKLHTYAEQITIPGESYTITTDNGTLVVKWSGKVDFILMPYVYLG